MVRVGLPWTFMAARNPRTMFDFRQRPIVPVAAQQVSRLLKPFTGDDSDDEFLVGLPFVNVSYRWQ